ncbi:serine hydrolase [Herbiconiux sp. P18]|uniref:serine hydrolase n=1 Tax=Herbiconiux liangxiaofengii TaxID=3342795 RepID=UPI0035BB2F7B
MHPTRREPPTSAARPHRSPRTAAVALAAVLTLTGGTLAGCAPAATPATPTASVVATPVALPNSPLGEQAAWVIAAMNEESSTLEQELGERMTPELLEAAPAAQLTAIFAQLRAAAPWTPTAVDDGGDQATITITPASAEAAAAVPGLGSSGALDLQIAVDAAGTVSGLLFSPAAADRTPATSWQELSSAVEGFAADTSMQVTEVTDAGADATPLLDIGADESKPSGSMFKLYVLGAVADAVAAGSLTWETPLTITDDVKSLPSGELQDQPSGTTVTVREAAEKMISISDNTATDLLIAAVGPAAVERSFADLGHHDPAENTPLLTTRALFQLGWGDAAPRAAWEAAGSESERRAVLDALPTGLVTVPVTDVTTPVWQTGLDWFTTGDDLVAVHLGLQQKAATPTGAPVREILAMNNGLGDTFGDEWSYVAFKGGSSVGVLAGSWYLERADGRAFVVSVQGSSDDPAALADTATFFGQVDDAVSLLEKE